MFALIILSLIFLLFFGAFRAGWIHKETIEVVGRIATIVGVIATMLLFIFPPATSFDSPFSFELPGGITVSRGVPAASPAAAEATSPAAAEATSPAAAEATSPIPPTEMPTDSPIPPTEMPTDSPIPPTETPTDTPIPPTEMPTNTPIPPTETPTDTPIPPPTSPPSADPIISEIDGMKLLYVPEGEFLMGSADDDPDAYDHEKPRHTVFLSAYRIDETEVTNAMYRACVRAGGCDDSSLCGDHYKNSDYGNHPVICVSWDDATAYCEWAGRRLPTEAEWEKAAGGTDGRKWPWGNEPPTGELANIEGNDDGYDNTSPVGNYPAGASPYGALDMAGNVWEWVQDSYNADYYASTSSPDENPVNESPGGTKVLRGGSWWLTARYARVRDRDGYVANDHGVNGGFRCARSHP